MVWINSFVIAMRLGMEENVRVLEWVQRNAVRGGLEIL